MQKKERVRNDRKWEKKLENRQISKRKFKMGKPKI